MSDTTEDEAEAIRRRYVAVFGGTMDAARAQPLAVLRPLVAIADEQRDLYLSLGFEVDDPRA